MCWSTETDKLNYKDCIERVFLQEREWLCLFKALKTSGVQGLASCIVRRIFYEDDHTLERCIFLEKNYVGQTSCVVRIPKRKAYMSVSR